MSKMYYEDEDLQDPYQPPMYPNEYPPPYTMYPSYPTQYSTQAPVHYPAGPPKSPMFCNEGPQGYGNPYMQPGYPCAPQFTVNLQVQQPRWPGESQPQLMPPQTPYPIQQGTQSKLDDIRREDEIRSVSPKPNASVPIRLPEIKPKGRPGRKPGQRAAQRIPPAQISYSPAIVDIKTVKPTRKRRRYETEEEKTASRRERNRVAQERSRQRQKDRIAQLENYMKDMKREVGTINGSLFELLSIITENNMIEILQSAEFKSTLQTAREANEKWFATGSEVHTDADSTSENGDE